MDNKQFIDELLRTQTESGKEYKMVFLVAKYLNELKIPYEIDEVGNIIATKGSGKIGLAAHMDTVHDIKSKPLKYYKDKKGNLHGYTQTVKKNGKVKYHASGIGGDDKVGIYLIFRLLQNFDNIKAFFFIQEEVGSIGADFMDTKHLDSLSYIIQIDRQKVEDVVTKYYNTSLISKAFRKAIKPVLKKHNRVEADGLTTDVISLAEAGKLDVSCINVSCGYYNPHTPNEYINIKDVEKTYSLIASLIRKLGTQRYEYHYETSSYADRWYKNYNSIYGKKQKQYSYEEHYSSIIDDEPLYPAVDDDDDDDLKNYSQWSKQYIKELQYGK